MEGVMDEAGLDSCFFAGEGGGEAGHLEGGSGEEALADGHVSGIATAPGFVMDFHFPFWIWDDHALAFEKEFDPCGFMEAEGSCFGGNFFWAYLEGNWVKVNVATCLDGAAEVDGAEGEVFMFGKDAVADAEATAAGKNVAWGHDPVF